MGNIGNIAGSETKLQAQQQTGGDYANVVRGKAVAVQSGAIGLGSGATYGETGSINLSGAKNPTVNLTITDTSGSNAAWADALKNVTAANNAALDKTLKSQSDISENTSGVLQDLLTQMADTVQTGQTGASPSLLKWLGLGLLAAVVLIFYFRRSH